ncbi:hypothetical protein T4B_11634 [Trichinella pseudospiralis]|uniref:Uncharacterized protein n=1 Tax=Trichinella pseudospiralis TaxID=6337 RepID=A0A0V1G7M4_TRIPS|nr:hypothetical protein T4B_11634 [Trichinella pseudospiralis]
MKTVQNETFRDEKSLLMKAIKFAVSTQTSSYPAKQTQHHGLDHSR